MSNPAYQQTPEQLWDSLKTNRDGLSAKEVEQRIQDYGKNILAELDKTPKWIKFLQQFKDVLIILLIASMFISIYLDDLR